MIPETTKAPRLSKEKRAFHISGVLFRYSHLVPEPFKDETGLTRRTVMRAAAWSVPVIAAAVATPMSAASGPGEITTAVATLIEPQAIAISLTLTPAVRPDPRVSNFTLPDFPEVLVQGLSLTNYAGSMEGDIYTNRAVPAGAVLLINLDGFAPLAVPITFH